MFNFQYVESGVVFGLKYIFTKRGHGIGMHTHEEEDRHNCIVLKGSIQIYGPEKKWCHTLKAGDFYDIKPEEHPHEICALEDDTQILGLNIYGKPPGEDIPERIMKSIGYNNKPCTIPLE